MLTRGGFRPRHAAPQGSVGLAALPPQDSSPVGQTPGALGSFCWGTLRGSRCPHGASSVTSPDPPLSRTAKPATDLLALSMSSSSLSHRVPSGLFRGLLERACREEMTIRWRGPLKRGSFLRFKATVLFDKGRF